MALINILQSDTFNTFRTKTNTLATQVGDNSTLLANSTLDSQLITNVVDGLVYTLTRLETENGVVANLLTSSKILVGAINEHEVDIGTVSELTTTATNLVNSINELDSEIGDLADLNIAGATETTATIVGFMNEMDFYFDSRIGDVSELYTPTKTNTVTAINEFWDREDAKYRNTLVLDLTDATVTEANYSFNTDGTKNQAGARLNSEFQEILSNVRIVSGRTLEIDGTLDVTSGTLLVGGGAGTLNITSTFLNLGDEANGNAINGGIRVLRKSEDGVARDRAIVYWDESTWRWRVQDLDFDLKVTGREVTTTNNSNQATVDDIAGIQVGQYLRGNSNIPDFTYVTNIATDETLTLSNNATGTGTESTVFADQVTDTPHILTSRNIGEYVSSGSTQKGISVTHNESENRLNFDVNDFTITLAGDLSGSVTITDLASATLTATVVQDAIELGTDTTGAYVKSISLASSSGLSMTQTTANTESNVITQLKVDSSVVRTSGDQSIGGVKTFSNTPIFSAGFDSNSDSTIDGKLTVTGDTVLNGNLTVTGTTTYVNTETLNISDNVMTLNSDFGTASDYDGAAPTENAGIEVERGALTNTSLLWNETDDVWQISDGTSTYTLVGSIVLDNAQLSARTINTEAGSKTVVVNSYTGIAVGDNIVSAHIPANTFVTAINGTTNISISNAATATATTVNATFTHAAGLSINTSGHVTTLEHYTPSSVALDSNNSNGTVLQDIAFDQFGHVKSIGTVDLDGRYYTESESDSRFVNTAGDTMTGDLSMSFYGTVASPGFTQTSTGDGTTYKFALPYYVGSDGTNILSVTVNGVTNTEYTIAGRFLTFITAPAATHPVVIKGKAPRLLKGDVQGNAKTSDESLKWSTGRKISLTGGATGNVTIDGSADVSMSVTVANNSHDHSIDNITNFTSNVQSIVGAMVDPTLPTVGGNTESGIIVSYDTTNQKLNFNVNDPKISLTGPVEGSATMTNLGDVSIVTSINISSLRTEIESALPRIYNINGTQIFP